MFMHIKQLGSKKEPAWLLPAQHGWRAVSNPGYVVYIIYGVIQCANQIE